MLLSLQPALRAGPCRAVRDLPSQRGAAAPAAAAALRLSPGASLARGMGISLSSGAGRASRLSVRRALVGLGPSSDVALLCLVAGAPLAPGDPVRARRI